MLQFVLAIVSYCFCSLIETIKLVSLKMGK